MAEFKCYVCLEKVSTGEKFTFTKSGAVHFDCFIANRRKEVGQKHGEILSDLAVILDSELSHLLALLRIEAHNEEAKKLLSFKYKEIEKTCGETTKIISNLTN
ncbi:hypothetical protein B1A_14971 [mine drainage metagenome]|uniref:DUF2175 domain-containing protein n=1 Tax=mine drainage metagenome TaxID=410659 RepID=T0ZAU1_9ZZZZ